MKKPVTLTGDQVAELLDGARVRLEEERRAEFAAFGIGGDCLWPAARLYHRHSALGPAWRPALTIAEVEALTYDLGYKAYPGAQQVELPVGDALGPGLEETIRARRSSCRFSEQAVSIEKLAKLLELGAGVTEIDSLPRRAAPSGGALYPLETYAVAFNVTTLSPGIFHYRNLDHALERIGPAALDDVRTFLPPKLLDDRPAVLLALSAVFARTQMKYLERGYRFALLEAGHIAQNLLLVATALGLSAVPVGGFWDEPFNEFLGLDPDAEAIVYSVLVGESPSNPD